MPNSVNISKVSPIKIVGGQSIERITSSSNTKSMQQRSHSHSDPKVCLPIRRKIHSNDNQIDDDQSEYFNYYIVENDLGNKNTESKNNSGMKITLRISERNRSTRQESIGENNTVQGSKSNTRKSVEILQDEILHTPSKSLAINKLKNAAKKPIETIENRANNCDTPVKRLRCHENTTAARKSLSSGISPDEQSAFGVARERLHVSAVPTCMPCREKEFENIYNFLKCRIQDQSGGCIYISGVPGTGKTAIVTSVIRSLQQNSNEKNLSHFEYLKINGMHLSEPRKVYVQIYKQLSGKTVPWEQARSLLNTMLTTRTPKGHSKSTIVLLVDELDMLCNRRQDVVYNLFDWPTKAAGCFILITIANTMDLPERLFLGKVSSRLGFTRLTFQPYTYRQLQDIVTERVKSTGAFNLDAIQLVTRKVAAVSGDARRALDICRRATEIADNQIDKENAAKKCVTMQHIQQALDEMIASPKVQVINSCSQLEQIFLQAIVAEIKRTGVEENSFMGIYTQVESLAAFESMPNCLTTGRCLRACANLCAVRLLISDNPRNNIFQKILLNVSIDDIQYALRTPKPK